MQPTIDIDNIHRNIRSARKAVKELKRLGEDFPAVARNAERMLASLKMLEINVSDVIDLGGMHREGR
jgi:hypothetical protein